MAVVPLSDDPEDLADANIYNMAATVTSEYGWTPDKIDSLYCDDIDYFGLKWHYDQIIEKNKKLKDAINQKK